MTELGALSFAWRALRAHPASFLLAGLAAALAPVAVGAAYLAGPRPGTTTGALAAALLAVAGALLGVAALVGVVLTLGLVSGAALLLGGALCGVGVVAAYPAVVLAHGHAYLFLNGEPVDAR